MACVHISTAFCCAPIYSILPDARTGTITVSHMLGGISTIEVKTGHVERQLVCAPSYLTRIDDDLVAGCDDGRVKKWIGYFLGKVTEPHVLDTR